MDSENEKEGKIKYNKFDDLDIDSEAYMDKVKGAMYDYLTELSKGPISKDAYYKHPDGLFYKNRVPYVEEVLGCTDIICYKKDEKNDGYYGLTKTAREIIDACGEHGKKLIIDRVAHLAVTAKKEEWYISFTRKGEWKRRR